MAILASVVRLTSKHLGAGQGRSSRRGKCRYFETPPKLPLGEQMHSRSPKCR